MRCANCGRDGRPGDVFCAGCGHELERTCARCGRVNHADARFCVSCGIELEEVAAPIADRLAGGGPDAVDAAPTPSDLDGIEYEDDPGPPVWEPLLVPASGLPAWTEPDGSGPVAAELPADSQVLVSERRGAWARVSVESGWTGWVDGRRLVDPDLADAPAPEERTS